MKSLREETKFPILEKSLLGWIRTEYADAIHHGVSVSEARFRLYNSACGFLESLRRTIEAEEKTALMIETAYAMPCGSMARKWAEVMLKAYEDEDGDGDEDEDEEGGCPVGCENSEKQPCSS